jgi:hypothetical protein
MTYRFDRALSLRSRDVHWSVAYANRNTKALLLKNGKIHRELNRSFYCAESYDYPIALGEYLGGDVLVAHCPRSFDTLEIEDTETGAMLDGLKTKEMEFHSRLCFSGDGRSLIDAGWFWHPWCGAAVFQLTRTIEGSIRFSKDRPFLAQNEIDSIAFAGNAALVVSSAPDYRGEAPEPGNLRPKHLAFGL